MLTKEGISQLSDEELNTIDLTKLSKKEKSIVEHERRRRQAVLDLLSGKPINIK